MKRKIVIPPSTLEPKFLLLMTWFVVIPMLLHYGFGL
jgi:hypothetical protein